MSKRLVALCAFFAFLFSSIGIRCACIALGKTYRVGDAYNSYTLDISTLYTTIYDRRGERINNDKTAYTAIIRPNEKCLNELELLFDDDEIKSITSELSNGYPVIRDVDEKADTQYIKIVEKTVDSSNTAYHLLSSETGGLKQYVSEETGSLSVNFTVDALGRLLSGDEGTIIDNNYSSSDGIIISLDLRLQKIAEDASKTLDKGAVVIMDTASSQLLASVSCGSDYINRAISPYAVGSVFKLVVCACALENDIDILYNCKSSIMVNDTKFSCQNNHSHGLQNLKSALANSCNCYFVNLALKLGSDKLEKTARSFGFGDTFKLYEGWNILSGNFPDSSELLSSGQLALLGFGQGMLTDSPVHFASVISCIANGGNYSFPTLDINDVEKNTVIQESTSKKLCEYMRYVVTNGTGANAEYKSNTAGKTATAQSGTYVGNDEILNTWFAGFYPYSNPKYAIVVMCENGTSGSEDCCPVFRRIVEKIDNM